MGDTGGSSGSGDRFAKDLYDNRKEETLQELYDEFRSDIEDLREHMKTFERDYAPFKPMEGKERLDFINALKDEMAHRTASGYAMRDLIEKDAELRKTYGKMKSDSLKARGGAVYEIYLKNGGYREITTHFDVDPLELKGINRRSVAYIRIKSGGKTRDSIGLNTTLEKHRSKYNADRYWDSINSLFGKKE